MSSVRPLEAADIDQVAALYLETFLRRGKSPSLDLITCLENFYLSGPTVDRQIPSLVHVNDKGAISGFVGVNVVPMKFSENRLRAAFGGTLMVRDREQDPMAGARLLKTFLSGPQDLSLSETANTTSLEMAKALRGVPFASYSLEWMRILKPAAFACDMALRKSSLRKWALPAARGLDWLHGWSGYAGGRVAKDAARTAKAEPVKHVDAEAFAGSVEILTSHYQLRPDWPGPQWRHVVREAFEKPLYGQPVAALVTGNGSPIGAFLYHLREGGVGRVLQMLALPGREGKVIDCLLADADRRGAAGLRGRTHPAFLEAMLGRNMMFANVTNTVAFCRDEAIIDCFRRGQALANGLAGESWGRHIGGNFT
ncbi:hypothetical protein GGE45_001618 [Rhizobium aethiopicum]|uniref:Uncharacterized protein n=1 Tax=Rhizobium aethiopicum TaxID=1138170 RepID=A0A7W6MJ28_9HYPH|nr:hypothetical protein [Rhizobium aethiopicum]MBB4193033.1 hypothetical protein [Rhizobium aethiopicum]MBB4579294.1 hypothetical protein [Rhizobium aethiopicum]